MGTRLRIAHRCVEWDGWEEGLVDSILGPEELEEAWFTEVDEQHGVDGLEGIITPPLPLVDSAYSSSSSDENSHPPDILQASVRRKKSSAAQLPFIKETETEKEKLLDTTGDFCGGKGGELGRRLDALLSVHGTEEGIIPSRWTKEMEDAEYEYDGGAE